MSEFEPRLKVLRAQLVEQGVRVHEIVQRAVDCAFDLDVDRASDVVGLDAEIDRVDVEIERASIQLLMLPEQDEHRVRTAITIVKINNELERIADAAVVVAETVKDYAESMEAPPATFRVMANSVIGILRDANRAFADENVDLAQQVLGFDDTVASFKEEIGLDAERQVAEGRLSVSYAFRLRTIAAQLERIADHCTNICEQIIYLGSGKTVRQTAGRWGSPELPGFEGGGPKEGGDR